MRAMVLSRQSPISDRPLALAEPPRPLPGPGEVRLAVRACGICRTDLHIIEGDLPLARSPVIPGHQVVGIVDAIGEGVERVRPGDRVGAAWLYSADGTCDACRRGDENLCPDARFTGYHADGGYAEAMVAPAAFVYPIPSSIGDEAAAPLLCAGIIGYRSLRRAGVQPGERVGLFGFGQSAHLAIQVLRHWGCEAFVFTRSRHHRDLASRLGAAWTGGSGDGPPGGLDRAVIFAPAGAVVHDALRAVRPGGTVAINAIHMTPIPELPYPLLYGERTVRSVANATRSDGEAFLRLAAEIPIRTDVETFPLEEANEALARLKGGAITGAAVLRVEPRTD